MYVVDVKQKTKTVSFLKLNKKRKKTKEYNFEKSRLSAETPRAAIVREIIPDP